VEQIGESLLDNGPVWEGRHAYALTRWHFSWGWRTLQEGDACRLADVRVKVAVEITLPQWVDWHRGSRRLQGRWERFERALLIHEHGHRDLGFRAASEIFRQLTAARASECLDVGVIARARARAVIQRYERLNDRYERDTRWGQTQGAVWPPEA
jgi:predicted secreted Zn-dependent protease